MQSPLRAGSGPVVLGEEFSPNFPVYPCGAAAGGFTHPPEAGGLGFQILSGKWTSTFQSRGVGGGQSGSSGLTGES